MPALLRLLLVFIPLTQQVSSFGPLSIQSGSRTKPQRTMSALLRLVLAFIPLTQQVLSFGPLSIQSGSRIKLRTPLAAAPEGALSDIVIPSVFTGGVFANANTGSRDDDGEAEEEDPRVWVPQTDCLSFRPLCFCVSQGYYVNLLKFKGGGVLGCHRHPSPVHALTLKGSWGYKEHDWHARDGTYVFEPPGETHTLIVDDDCDEMVAMFHVTGALIYVDPDSGAVTGYDDVFTKLEKARDWYEECGLGRDYAEQFIR